MFDEEQGGDDKDAYDYHGNLDSETVCDVSCTCPTAENCGQDHSTCKSKCKDHYFGRGYLQLTWHANYVEAEAWISGLGDDPSKAKTNPWMSAAWYWKCRVRSNSCDGPTREQVIEVDSHKFSASTWAINGDLECPYGLVYDKWDPVTGKDTYQCPGGEKNCTMDEHHHRAHAYCRTYFFETMFEAVDGGTIASKDDECCFDHGCYVAYMDDTKCK